MFSLVYFPENGCSELFESVALLEEHVLAGNHKRVTEICSVNRIKQILIDNMICTAQFHHPYVSSSVEKGNASFPEGSYNITLLGTFAGKRWASPVQNIIKHCYKQKNILFDCFLKGKTAR